MGVWARHASRPKRARAQAPEPAPEPEPEPAPAPAPPALRPLPVRAPEPELGPEPEAEPEPQREPEPAVAYLPLSEEAREWNLWELERVARENITADVAKNEERAYLLMYLREFAGPDGTLPADFDGLVRDSFGDLLRVVAL
jgi:hypothetical protein